jgi:hypothetical protein
LFLGDDTEIGERGANLTLPQRHRVSIARAVYSDASILLMDDPLSTMDAQIGKRIFNECISGYLKDKAVIMVTSQLQFLERCDQIVIMNDGQSTEQGTFEELIAKDLNLATLVGESIEIEDPYLVDDLVDEIELNQPGPTADEEANDLSFKRFGKRPANIITNNNSLSNNNINSTNTSTGPAITFAEVEKPDRVAAMAESGNEASMGRGSTRTSPVTGNIMGIGLNGSVSANNNNNSNDLTMGAHNMNNQLTIMGGTILGTMGHGNNTLAKALERSQLTIHSLHDLQGDDVDLSGRNGHSSSDWSAYLLFMRCATGVPIFATICLFFMVVQSLRIFSGK